MADNLDGFVAFYQQKVIDFLEDFGVSKITIQLIVN